MISGYRLMWLMVMFDLPVETKKNRRDYRRFVDKMEDDGYMRIQFSIYVRPCTTEEKTATHLDRVVGWLPPEGEVRVLKFTDKQWGRMQVFRERDLVATERPPEQFLFFDEEGEVLVDAADRDDVAKQAQVTEVRASEIYDRPPATSFAVVMETLTRLNQRGSGRKKGRPKKSDAPSFDFDG